MENTLWTIGYEQRTVHSFLSILKQENVERVVDVRENPWSRKKGFTKDELRTELGEEGLEYEHCAPLGAPKSMRDKIGGEWDEEQFFRAYSHYLTAHSEDLERLEGDLHEKRTALLCYERDPEDCHRSVIADELEGNGWEIIHI